MCKFYDDIEKKRKKLNGIVNTNNLTDEQVVQESKKLDMLLNKKKFKCLDCKKKSKCNKVCREYSREEKKDGK